MQRAVAAPELITAPARFRAGLASWSDPSLHRRPGHLVSAAAPSGTGYGLAAPAAVRYWPAAGAPPLQRMTDAGLGTADVRVDDDVAVSLPVAVAPVPGRGLASAAGAPLPPPVRRPAVAQRWAGPTMLPPPDEPGALGRELEGPVALARSSPGSDPGNDGPDAAPTLGEPAGTGSRDPRLVSPGFGSAPTAGAAAAPDPLPATGRRRRLGLGAPLQRHTDPAPTRPQTPEATRPQEPVRQPTSAGSVHLQDRPTTAAEPSTLPAGGGERVDPRPEIGAPVQRSALSGGTTPTPGPVAPPSMRPAPLPGGSNLLPADPDAAGLPADAARLLGDTAPLLGGGDPRQVGPGDTYLVAGRQAARSAPHGETTVQHSEAGGLPAVGRTPPAGPYPASAAPVQRSVPLPRNPAPRPAVTAPALGDMAVRLPIHPGDPRPVMDRVPSGAVPAGGSTPLQSTPVLRSSRAASPAARGAPTPMYPALVQRVAASSPGPGGLEGQSALPELPVPAGEPALVLAPLLGGVDPRATGAAAGEAGTASSPVGRSVARLVDERPAPPTLGLAAPAPATAPSRTVLPSMPARTETPAAGPLVEAATQREPADAARPAAEAAVTPDTAAAVSAAEPSRTRSTPATAPPASNAPTDIDALVGRLYDPLVRRLKAELRLDRERVGRALDLRH